MTEIFIPDFIKDYVNKCICNGKLASGRIRKYIKENDDFNQWLISNNFTVRQIKYLIDNNLNHIPVCPVCGKELNGYELTGASKYCSNKCAQLSDEVREKIKQTCLKKYGETVPIKNKEIKEKTKKTCIERYGVDNYFKTNEYKEKYKKTLQEKYGKGITNAFQANEIKEKIKKTISEKYGVEYISQSEEIKEKKKQTTLNHFGVDNPLQSDFIKEKIKQTNIEKYDCEYYAQTKEWKEKYKETCLEKYGSEYYAQTNDYKERYKNTCLEKYGTDNYFKSDVFRKQYEKICQEKYGPGITNSFQSKEIIQNITKQRRESYYNVLIKLLNYKNIALLMEKNEYINSNILKFKCLKCNNIFETERKNAQDIFCPNCAKKSYSLKEKELLEWIKSIYSDEIIENDRTILNGKELDIYIPKKKLAIEFNGDYWHSTKIKDKYYHQEKTLACKEKEIRLIHIFENEWKNKRTICESIIKSALGIYNKKIYARKCVIKKINSASYRDFLDINHLQGAINSSIRYGLYYEDELVSVIGFGKSRFKKDEMELHRFCSKLGYQVIGAFSKLIKHSNVTNFITYVDLSHFSGKGYKSLGFKELSVTEPNYKWVKGDIALNRFQTQKHKLKELLNEHYDESLTEVENMEMNGYYQLFDSGNLKLQFKISNQF